jgi:hypothetical protein
MVKIGLKSRNSLEPELVRNLDHMRKNSSVSYKEGRNSRN